MTLKQIIALTFAYYNRGQTLPDALLEMYAGDLADLDQATCAGGYTVWRRNPQNTRFPLPAEIRQLVNPDAFISPETKAREVAQRIVGAIPKYGWNNAKDAQAFIGPEGWEVVNRQGGWTYLCENVGEGIPASVLQAQLRDQLIGQFKYGTQVIEQSIGASSRMDPRTGSLEPAGKGILSLIPGENEKGPA